MPTSSEKLRKNIGPEIANISSDVCERVVQIGSKESIAANVLMVVIWPRSNSIRKCNMCIAYEINFSLISQLFCALFKYKIVMSLLEHPLF